MKRLAFLATALLFPVAAHAADAPDRDQPREKVMTLVVYGNDACPRSTDDEIVVCARLPENERYRIPKRFRGKKQEAAGRAWGDRVQSIEMVGKSGLPNSCSPNGSFGQTGCFQKFLEQAREERAAAKAEQSQIP